MKFGLHEYTITAFLKQVFEKYPDCDSLALTGEKPFSYSEMRTKIKTIQIMLLKQGISLGDKVSITGVSRPDWALAYLAVMDLGAVAVPIMEDYPHSDIIEIINFSDSKGIFADSRFCESVIQECPNLNFVFDMNKQELAKEYNGPAAVREKPVEEDLAELLFTSGTTGHSKGVMLTHGNLVSNIFEGPDMIRCIHRKSRTLSLLPMAHAYGSTSSFLSIIYGGSAVYFLGKKPTPPVLMKALASVKPTILGGVPMIFEKIYNKKVQPIINKNGLTKALSSFGPTHRLLLKIIGKKVNQAFGGNIDCAIIGGAPVAPEVEEFLRLAKIPTVLGYGMTEAAPLITFCAREEIKPGSVGRAITDLIIEVRDKGKDGTGEIWIKGPNIMKGYYKNPEETAKILTPDGWLNTGDLGYLDNDGFLFLKGRSKNVIIGPAGENIYPEIIESVLSGYSQVEESFVYEQGSIITARIFPGEALLKSVTGKGDIKKILDGLKEQANKALPHYSRISKMIWQTVPFEKTVSQKIRRVNANTEDRV